MRSKLDQAQMPKVPKAPSLDASPPLDQKKVGAIDVLLFPITLIALALAALRRQPTAEVGSPMPTEMVFPYEEDGFIAEALLNQAHLLLLAGRGEEAYATMENPKFSFAQIDSRGNVTREFIEKCFEDGPDKTHVLNFVQEQAQAELNERRDQLDLTSITVLERNGASRWD